MTKQEAIEVINEYGTLFPSDKQEAIDMALDALEQEPSEDCISRADLQELFNVTTTSLMDKIDQKDIEHLVRACLMVTEMIQDAPSVVPKRGKWVPVTERLPEEGLTVLILAENGHIEFGQRDENKWEWLAESIADYWTEAEEVIAWQPLPEPYEESDGK